MTGITFLLLMAMTGSSSAMCFGEASRQYGVPEALLRATAAVESANNPSLIGRNADGTFDMGMMQINSSWLPKLEKWGISRAILLKDACMNIKVGAWIIAQNIRQHGYNWTAVGAYNVGCRNMSAAKCQSRRNKYSGKIYQALMRIERGNRKTIAQKDGDSPSQGITSVSFSRPSVHSPGGES